MIELQCLAGLLALQRLSERFVARLRRSLAPPAALVAPAANGKGIFNEGRRHGSPTTIQWQRRDPDGRWSASATVLKCFGSWAQALTQAGLPVSSQAGRPVWTRQSMLDALSGFAAEHGRPPGTDELRFEHGLPWGETLAKHFGSLAAAYDAAALGKPRRSDRPVVREWDRAQVLDAIVAFKREHGRPPTYADWQRGSSEHPAGATVRRIFGS